jgi:hypothetical protein
METIKLQIPCCIKVDNELEFYFVIGTMLNCGYKKIGAFWEYDKMLLTDIGILTENRIQTLANKPYKEYSYEQFLNSQFIKSKNMKFKVGDKVVPHSKSYFSHEDLESSAMWNLRGGKKQGFLYITKIELDMIVCSNIIEEYAGDYFLESDLTLFKEKVMKKYKVIKEFDHKKVGETLELDDNLGTTVQWLDSNEFVVQSTIKDLISKEFIKEVQELNFKPGDFITGTWGDDVRKIVECKPNDCWEDDFSWRQENLDGSINDSFQHSWGLSSTKKATKDQIKNWYIQSAKERGYTKGVKFKSLHNKSVQEIDRTGFNVGINSDTDVYFVSTSTVQYSSSKFDGSNIFEKNKWAEIINVPKKEVLKICGYDVVFNEDNTITTGCKDDITKEQLENMIKVSNFCYEHNIDLKFNQDQIYVLGRGTNEVNQREVIEKVISKLK